MLTYNELGNIEYWGKLGNQLFEISATIGVAIKNNVPFIFPEWNYSKYFKNKLPAGNIKIDSIIFETSINKYQDIILKRNLNYSLNGYFQSFKFFDFCKNKILYYFTPNFKVNEPFTEVAIHVRRGDYLDRSNFHTNLTMEYYEEAMSYFPNCSFSIFSDDIDWCKNNFSSKHTFVSPDTDIVDLIFMSRHQHQIIANSSYSWWGAYLNQNVDKKVIAPKHWFANGLGSEDMHPPEWIVI